LPAESRYGRLKEWAGNLYLFYAIRRFGWADGLHRFWTYHLHPKNAWDWARDAYKAWRLVDRRKKLRGYSRNIYLVNRDGDLGVVECPECHRLQGLVFERISYVFNCSHCGVTFQVYLEDGLVTARDHREGSIPLPGKCTEDDHGIYHLGINRDAPWWWGRKTIYRDYNPETGKDGHGHKPYSIVLPKPSQPRPPGDGETEIADAR
jgi:ribosomal protein S27E